MHFDVHGHCYVVGCCNVPVVAILSISDMVCLDYAETVQCMGNARSVW